MNGTCIICGLAAQVQLMGSGHIYECDRCGAFGMSALIEQSVRNLQERERQDIGFWVRSRPELGLRFPFILTEPQNQSDQHFTYIDLHTVLQEMRQLSYAHRFDRALQNLGKKSPILGKRTKLQEVDIPLVYAASLPNAYFILRNLAERGYLEIDSKEAPSYFTVTGEGWRRIGELESPRASLKQAFIAMAFDPALRAVYDNGIELAVRSTGYLPLRIDLKEHNEKICDLIVAEIRVSRFLVADLTLHRPGVYFEAGLALGLGMPVIWLCREDDLGNSHFDTRQYNFILWNNPSEAREKLAQRILATIGRPPNTV